MRTSFKTAVLGMVAALVTTGTAQAHYLWIEQSNAGAQLFFGEVQEGIKEKSPGKLDNIKAPIASVQKARGQSFVPVEAKRKENGFAIAESKGVAAVNVVEESLDVRDLTKHGLGHAKSNYYARSGKAADENAMMALDVQQLAPNRFVVKYRGQPLVNAKLEVVAPNTWVQEHKADANGAVEINTPWRGQYLLHVLHVDPTQGEYQGKKYESLRNHLTYTFVNSKGADPGPATPPKRTGE
jgi:uncharacterized GH25 family protein